jgi:1-acyl-sn-glycerol-3-phosphate acyltransferase
MSKIEIMKIPLVGWMMRLARDIPLTRGDAASGTAALEASRERLDSKVSVMIFPEGTRSKTGELREFKGGAFRLAIEAQVPILPLAVYGTRDALRKHDWRLGYAEAEVRVLEPVSTEGLTIDDTPGWRASVRDRIAAAREDLRREFGHGATDAEPGESAAAG